MRGPESSKNLQKLRMGEVWEREQWIPDRLLRWTQKGGQSNEGRREEREERKKWEE